MTWKYRGLKGVAEGYKGLQRVTRGYKGLQGVTGGYKGFDQNHGLNPLEKMPILMVCKTDVFVVQKGLFAT